MCADIPQGHDSTSQTLSWWVKIMAANPGPQAQLRAALRAAFPDTKTPTAAQILDTDVPYLDAVVEETMRSLRHGQRRGAHRDRRHPRSWATLCRPAPRC